MVTAAEREELIKRYEAGPSLIREALAKVPAEAMTWRPASGKWSVHQVVCHCADSETNSAMRIRYLVGEDTPTIVGYDQDAWARTFDYHGFPLDVALAQVETVRRWTAAFIRRLPEAAGSRSGTHTEMPAEPYTAEKWLRIYAEHLEVHARQIGRNVEAFRASGR
jgi:hypothetical protein